MRKYGFWIRELCPNRKAVTNVLLSKQYLGKQIQSQGSLFVFRQVLSREIRPVKEKSHKLGYYHKETAKNEFAPKKLAQTVPIFVSRRHEGSSETWQNFLFFYLASSFMHDWSRHSTLSQSRVPLYERSWKCCPRPQARAAFSSPSSQFFTIRTDPKPANNLFIFFLL